MRALRSLAFGVAVLSTMLLLLLTNLGLWVSSTLLDASTLARTAGSVLQDPAVRDHVSREVGAAVAASVLDQGPLPGAVRSALDLPARPSEAELASALAGRIDGLLADVATGSALGLASAAFSRIVSDALERSREPGGEAAREGLVADLTPIGRLVLDRIDTTGGLAGALPAGAVTVRVLDGDATALIVPVLRLVDALRWLLPLGCLVGIAAIVVLARYRVHALAWVGLCGVVAGTVSLLVASGLPVVVPRSTDLGPRQAVAVTAALDGITASLVTQSAVLAGLGLALVVAGIAGGIVVSRGDAEGDLRHTWDSGRLS